MGLEDCPGRYVLEPHGASIQGPMQRNRPHVTDPTAPGWPRRWAVRYIHFSLHVVIAAWSAWRIRLVAYGARLESVLGASPRGFESPILRSASPGSVEIPGFSLCFQRFWAGGIETDIYRLVRLGAVKTPPIRPHQFEVRLSCRNSLQGSRGTQCVKNIGRAPIPR